MDSFTREMLDNLYAPAADDSAAARPAGSRSGDIADLLAAAASGNKTGPISSLFCRLKEEKADAGRTPDAFGISREQLEELAVRHERMDEHEVTVGGRVDRALPIVEAANARVDEYLDRMAAEAPSGIELWDRIQENAARIRAELKMDEAAWGTYKGQIRNCINDAATLSRVTDLSEADIVEVTRVTDTYRMRLTPYYASLIQPGRRNDPVLLQSVPSHEMVDNAGEEIPPVAADHSPARLIDQFYPRVVTIKATNMCAMYCTHCLRIAHIGKKDQVYPEAAYEEALDYIRKNHRIRDVLITGGDSFVLPDKILKKILGALDEIDHVRMKRLGTRIPVTSPQRIDAGLLDILAESNEKKPVRVVTQINTAQEITPVSKDAFRRISGAVSAVLNQAVLLRGINDTKFKMWKLCETVQESYVRPYYIFNCSYRNPQFTHFRVPVEKGRDIVESMYGNISGDAIPRYIATAGGKIPLHRSNVGDRSGNDLILTKPWSGEQVRYPDADPDLYADDNFAFRRKER